LRCSWNSIGTTERLSERNEEYHANLRLAGVSAMIRATCLPNTSEKCCRLNTSLANYSYVSVELVMCDVRHNLRHPEVHLSSEHSYVFVMSDAAWPYVCFHVDTTVSGLVVRVSDY
jgi:hypothetical protein